MYQIAISIFAKWLNSSTSSSIALENMTQQEMNRIRTDLANAGVNNVNQRVVDVPIVGSASSTRALGTMGTLNYSNNTNRTENVD